MRSRSSTHSTGRKRSSRATRKRIAARAPRRQPCYRDLITQSTDTRIKADAARASGDVRAANAFFQTAIKEYPEDPALRARWGELFVATHQNNEAARLFEEALSSTKSTRPRKSV